MSPLAQRLQRLNRSSAFDFSRATLHRFLYIAVALTVIFPVLTTGSSRRRSLSSANVNVIGPSSPDIRCDSPPPAKSSPHSALDDSHTDR